MRARNIASAIIIQGSVELIQNLRYNAKHLGANKLITAGIRRIREKLNGSNPGVAIEQPVTSSHCARDILI